MPGPLIGLGLLAGKTWFDNQARGKQLSEKQMLQDRFMLAVGSAGGEQQLQGGLVQDRGPGTGLLADPTNLDNMFQFATSVMSIPGREQQGTQLLNNILNISQTRRANELDRIQTQQLEDQKLFNGDSRIVLGDGVHGQQGVRYKIYTPGSEGWIKNMQPIQSARLGITSFNRMIGLVEDHGTEAWGTKSAEMGILYEDLKARLAQAWEKGVLQKDEAEQLESALPNPAKISALGWSAASVKAALTEARALFERKIVSHQELVDPTGHMTRMLTGTTSTVADKTPLPTLQDFLDADPDLEVDTGSGGGGGGEQVQVGPVETVQDQIADRTDASRQFGSLVAPPQEKSAVQNFGESILNTFQVKQGAGQRSRKKRRSRSRGRD